jgi:hypothetical protein
MERDADPFRRNLMHLDVTSPPTDGGPMDPESAGTPPAEALFALRVAGEVARRLHESGRELRFSSSPSRRRVEILLCDFDGAVLSRMTPSRALEIAAGSAVAGESTMSALGCGRYFTEPASSPWTK